MERSICIACQAGMHDECLGTRLPPPGMFGGDECTCEGDCKPQPDPQVEAAVKAVAPGQAERFMVAAYDDDPNGEWVRYPDYEKLAAAYEKLIDGAHEIADGARKQRDEELKERLTPERLEALLNAEATGGPSAFAAALDSIFEQARNA